MQWEGCAQSRCGCGRGAPSPGADVAGESSCGCGRGAPSPGADVGRGFLMRMWEGCAQSRCGCGQGCAQCRCGCGRSAPSPGADVAASTAKSEGRGALGAPWVRGEERARTKESVRSDVQTSTAARTTASMNSRSRSCPRRNARRIRASTRAGCARTQHPHAARLDAAAHATSFPHGSALTSLVSRRKPQHANRRCAVAPTDAEGRSLMCTDQPGLRTSAMP